MIGDLRADDEIAASPERGGFWRRLAAFVTDAVIISIALQLLGIYAYDLSGGHVQFSSGIYSIRCATTKPAPPATEIPTPPGVEIPPGLKATSVTFCANSFLGRPVARQMRVDLQGRDNGRVVEITLMLDSQDHLIHGFDLSQLFLPMLLLYRIGFEARNGQTIGKRLARARVTRIDSGAMTIGAAVKRNLVFFLPLLPVVIAGLTLSESFLQGHVMYYLIILIPVIGAIVMIWQIVSRWNTFYDNAAGTVVIRVQKPPVPYPL